MDTRLLVLVVDDDPDTRESLAMLLRLEGHEAVAAADGHKAILAAFRECPDVVLLDIAMPGRDGMSVLEESRKGWPDVPVVMMSGHGTIETAVRATRLGAFDFIEKPLSAEKLLLTLQHALDVSRLASENQRLRAEALRAHPILGASEPIQRLKQQIAQAAPTNGWVLIAGENGTGKELVARQVHLQSRRAAEPFVEVNCAAIPEELIESELFGHEKGAFTGATEKQIGKFEQADRGTIFLDEVGDMSQKTQAKVLRVLQEQEVERLGSARTIKVDVRVIAATNKNLEEAIERGEFREDLYFRLNVIPIVVPPLRERREDIPLLAEHFARRFSEEHNVRRRFDARALEALQNYRWRGNIRELRNTVERLVIMTDREVIGAADLPPDVAPSRASAPAEAGAAAPAPAAPAAAGGNTLREFKDASERAFLVQKLREHNWNISKTAEIIDTPRSNLYKKLEQYGIKQEIDG